MPNVSHGYMPGHLPTSRYLRSCSYLLLVLRTCLGSYAGWQMYLYLEAMKPSVQTVLKSAQADDGSYCTGLYVPRHMRRVVVDRLVMMIEAGEQI